MESSQDKFIRLAKEWQEGRPRGVDVAEMSSHLAYQQIIGMGTIAIPFILSSLRRKVDHWFVALYAITGQNPVPEKCKGNVMEVASAWIKWGRLNRYVD